MEEDAELGIAKPVGGTVRGQGIPIGMKACLDIGWRSFGVNLRYLVGDVGFIVRGRRRLREQGGNGAEESERGDSLHRVTIAES